MPGCPTMTLRPYQLLCGICSLGESDSGPGDCLVSVRSQKADCPPGTAADDRIADILKAVRQTPDMPITLRCNVGDVFAYQDPGHADDRPEGAEFNARRDLEILHKLNLTPGCTLPARIIFNRVLDAIEDVSGICGYPSVTSDDWKGCPKATSGDYERGRKRGIEAIIPARDKNEMKRLKAESLAAMYKAEAVSIRPHILLCAVCQYGGGTRPPYPEDNLPELIELILKEPDTVLAMAPHADWMMCAPCPYRAAGLNACLNNKGSGGLPNEMRDLRVLQKLGLTYGARVKARDVYKLIFERISGTLEICRIGQERPSVWWSGCGAATANSENYDKGRKMLMAAMGL